ncbi:hypothetical protein ABZW18_24290 [Streptomyces sp. NPDC004647]|uniref:hypothetical protein n=1 Tax=Streptomyces sp. NPDC004647 TaxID=3154671 RepID=UPI0033AE42C0
MRLFPPLQPGNSTRRIPFNLPGTPYALSKNRTLDGLGLPGSGASAPDLVLSLDEPDEPDDLTNPTLSAVQPALRVTTRDFGTRRHAAAGAPGKSCPRKALPLGACAP